MILNSLIIYQLNSVYTFKNIIMSEINLWPEGIFTRKINMPKNILLKQGNILSELSGNLLVAEVKSTVHENEFSGVQKIIHEFIIKAPSLGNYQLPLLRLIHEPISAYPLRVYSILEDVGFDVTDEENLLRALKHVFNHEKTQNAITYIVSQV